MLNHEEKAQVTAEIREKLGSSTGVVLADYRGLTVAQVTQLRVKLRAAGVEYRVLKNTLVKRAAQEVGVQGLDPFLEGPTAVAFSADPVAPAKILSEFAKTNKNFVIKAGVLEGKVIGADGVKVLADLPPREVLLAQVLRGMQAPLAGMVNVLQGPIRKLAYVLEAIRQAQEA
ncbi:Ribosomal protein L10, eubacterial, conserved site [Acididesulfobacillus acetoxydans]|uniref:Large ribosomal subunit protein uL10 n=1 Tax=Acididesulfobacillus acetoxydans TaxID=1561005 RepID=A0A8S0WWA0_9FIRM|nr:50S ribosomal protein L10 [Acididesulfobacillus acetoxydans]CAA7600131.1 Ribosomal protein L10, eubacterial, conserved site [Acididesulfobacillus acetoxydans]CEJ09509.1 50S ribosomal protein L10 [Acididesulfobacillus acetoxydans]